MRLIRTLLALLLIGVVAVSAAQLVFQPDPLDPLRGADQLLIAGRYYEAQAAYQRLATGPDSSAAAHARLGMVATIRGEQALAVTAFASALNQHPSSDDYALIRFYQGTLVAQGPSADYSAAIALWDLLPPSSALLPQREVLTAELLLHRGQYADAETALRRALAANPPIAWAQAAYTRLALLRASSDAQAAAAELAHAANPSGAMPVRGAARLAEPLVPASDRLRQELAGVLQASAAQRTQLLGQLYLDHELYPLAEAQFLAVGSAGPQGLAASAFLAYTRWRAGDQAGGLEQLRQLVLQHPEQPRARALLALVALDLNDLATARDQLAIIQQAAPGDPATYLAWGQWQAAQRDYLAAVASFQRALDLAPLAERSDYALYLARFHLDSAIQVCEVARPAAEIASTAAPKRSAAWVALAQARLACADPTGANSAIQQALQLDPHDPEAHYQAGRVLRALGDRAGARQALIAAADAQPGSRWQSRAERELTLLAP